MKKSRPFSRAAFACADVDIPDPIASVIHLRRGSAELFGLFLTRHAVIGHADRLRQHGGRDMRNDQPAIGNRP
jgi:hypothetical protein